MTSEKPALSVVVPMFNAPENLGLCLAALAASSVEHELVVADDASTDERAIRLAKEAADRYVRLEKNSGPAAARNAGARVAQGDVIAFVDSDVVVEPETLERLRDCLAEPGVAACFGSYDDRPAHSGLVSIYRNLLHHWVHHTGPRDASTFWAGCGAVRRAPFEQVGRFDEAYNRPSIEDIELGMRLKAAGHRIRLAPEIQGKHLKRWRFTEMVRVDVFCRAIPWTRLLLSRPGTGGDLNVSPAQQLCAALVLASLGSWTASVLGAVLGVSGAWWLWWLAWTLLAPVLWINRGLYALFLRRGGPLVLLVGLPLHLFYYVYSSAAYVWARAFRQRASALPGVLLALLASLGCGDEPAPPPVQQPPPVQRPSEPALPHTALPATRDGLLEGRAAKRSPADGGGRAWIEPPVEPAHVSAPGRWTIVYEAGPLGVAVGGGVYLQVSPFWNWSTPQVDEEELPGFTRVTSDAAGVELEARTVDRQLLHVEVRGRALAAGEHVRFEYGAGAAGALADPYAEADSRFWIGIDGDGDGVRAIVADSPGVPVLPGPPARLVLTLSSTARPGERVRLTVAVLDAEANAGIELAGTLRFEAPPEGLELPSEVALAEQDGGLTSVELVARTEGVYTVAARFVAPGVPGVTGVELEARSNPLLVSASGPRILWADLHGHTAESDGTGTPAAYYRYARNAAGLDVACLTDHDHWGILFLDEHPERWKAIVDARRELDVPGRFLALSGYEWTSWIHGHRCVVYFGDEAPLYSSLDASYDDPRELWAALRGKQALTIAHHTAGGPIALDWSIAPDTDLEPVTEIVSVHGSSEAWDSPKRIYSPVQGNFARDALDRGYRLGFVGSGDSHDGHPGLAHLGSHYPSSGVAAVLSEDLSRDGVLMAIRARRTYATSGQRILLRFAVAGARMGEVVPAARAAADGSVYLRVIGTTEIKSVEIVRSGVLFVSQPGDGDAELELSGSLADLQSGEYVYVRVEQADGGLAWSSPVFIE